MTRVVAFAYSGFGHAGLEALLRVGADVRLVLSHADAPGENCWWPRVADLCAARGIPCLLDADLKDPAVAERIAAANPDFLFSFYFRSLIPGRILRLAPRGGYNLHGSLLPRYRGRAPLNWMLVQGETRAGLTLHRMVREADAGDIVAQLPIDILLDEDALALVNRMLAVAPGFLDTAIRELFAGRAVHRVQDHRLATVFGRRRPEDGRIDWTRTARAVHNLVRAVARPFPGAFTFLDGTKVMVWRTRVVCDHQAGGAPGAIRDDGSVSCGDGLIEILEASDEAGTPFTLRPGSSFSLSAPSRAEVSP